MDKSGFTAMLARLPIVLLLTFVVLPRHAADTGESQLQNVSKELRSVMPIEWVHIPKTGGTSLINMLINLTGACPGLPAGLSISKKTMGVDFWGYFLKRYRPWSICSAKVLGMERFLGFGEMGISESSFQTGKGRFMTFLRQPEQLLLSRYYYYRWRINLRVPIKEYTRKYSGSMTKILARPGQSVSFNVSPPTRPEIDEAKLRLQTGFSFIGITGRWRDSMCLFTRIFAQACHPYMFANLHQTQTGGKSDSTYYTKKLLKNWRDPYDNEVFDAGMAILEDKLMQYRISASSCGACLGEGT